MGPGHRIETLTEHFNDWNWQKTLNIARFTRSAYSRAVQSLDLVMEELATLKENLGPDLVSELELAYNQSGGEQFLQDHRRLQSISSKDLFAEFQAAQGAEPASGPAVFPASKILHIDLICKALVLEGMQARLGQRLHDLARLKEPSAALHKRVMALADQVTNGLQKHYDLLFEVSPQLESIVQRDMDPAKDNIHLPTRMTAEEVAQFGLSDLLTLEIRPVVTIILGTPYIVTAQKSDEAN
ncbi:hypothetical protein FRC01_013216 [Tulasnella sp. 417]|nr:hypothetical protein FRC01_013216 [Tulasnella sp. 417]